RGGRIVADYVFYPITGDGLTKATEYTWNLGTIDFNSPNYWTEVAVFTTLTIGETAVTGVVPDGGANVGIIAGVISPFLFCFYVPNPSLGDPYIGSSNYPVDILLNSGSIVLGDLLLAGFNDYAAGSPQQFPTLAVASVTLTITGD